MISKYVVFATLVLLTLSASPAAFGVGKVLPGGKADTHGPRAESVTFSVLASDTQISDCLKVNTCQAVEWTLLASTWTSLSCSPGPCAKGASPGYDVDGVAFNTLRPYVNNIHFREAVQLMTNYALIAKDACESKGCAAEPYAIPCSPQYSASCYQLKVKYNLVAAANELLAAGLVLETKGTCTATGCTGSATTLYCLTPVSGDCTPVTIASGYTGPVTAAWLTGCPGPSCAMLGWYMHDSIGGGEYEYQVCAPLTNPPSGSCAFNPNYYYRNDDPYRTEIATLYVLAGSYIGFTFNTIGITDAEAGGDVYGASANAETTPGVYNPSCSFTDDNVITSAPQTEYGCNSKPTFNSAAVNGTVATGSSKITDSWDLYSFGWIVSPSPVAWAEFFNSQFVWDPDFGNYYNQTVDHYSDQVFYDTLLKGTDSATGCTIVPGTAPASNTCPVDGKYGAVYQLGAAVQQQLPYVISMWEIDLWAVNVNTVTGYVNEPAYGPSTSIGIYYTLLNAYQAADTYGYGGLINYPVHGPANSLNPLYYDNWIWQADLWGEIYDGPIGTPPAKSNVVNAYMDWMTTTPSVPKGSSASSPCNSYDVTKLGYGVACVTPFSAGFTTGSTQGSMSFNGLPYTYGWTDLQMCNGAFTGGVWGGTCSSTEPGHVAYTFGVAGYNVSFLFRNNITFSDGYPFTADDYNFSLFAWNIAVNPTTPTLYTPDECAACGPAGIFADYISKPYTSGPYAGDTRIDMFVASQAVWTPGLVMVGVFPVHVFQYFNLNNIATSTGAMDLLDNYATDITTCQNSVPTCVKTSDIGTVPTWITDLPSLEISVGPYYLSSIAGCTLGACSAGTEAGTLSAFANYQRTAWLVNATDHVSTTTSISLGLEAGNELSATTIGLIPINNFYDGAIPCSAITLASVSVTGYYIKGKISSEPFPYTVTGLTCTDNVKGAELSGTIALPATITLPGTKPRIEAPPKGTYEVIISVPYGTNGQVWYQFTGFTYT